MFLKKKNQKEKSKNSETHISIRSSIKTKKNIQDMRFGEATKFLEKSTTEAIHRKAIELPTYNWISIPFKEYNFLLGGYIPDSEGKFVPIYKVNASQVINFCRLIKTAKAAKGKLGGEQQAHVLRFEDVYHVVEHFHEMNHVYIKLTRDSKSTIIESQHTVGANWSKFLVELFRQTGEITQEFEVYNDKIIDSTLNQLGEHDPSKEPDPTEDGVKIYMKFVDNVDFENQKLQSDFAW
jgi:hypothetical protein